MYTYIQNICIYKHIDVQISVNMYKNIKIYNIYMYMYIYKHINMYTYAYIYEYMYMCIYICIYI